ncbi:hypothetical protein RND71_036776 [Anisodus tanguticus]|uniref:Uncharacterized protein n=1 Tax=Anisodus tanguticus TaxID=243964 RepID=A0AAE1R4R9_9SOLA|nr:hypothetical protein RND71_036776 [Anisodus tanguticus]
MSSKRMKKGVVSITEVEDAEPELGVNPEEADDKNSKTKERDVPETSKNKSKKKKGGRTIAQKDEDEIDKILAELEIGEGQATFALTPQEEKGQLGDDVFENEEVVEEGFVEFVAAKKKKKTKKKEKKKNMTTTSADASTMEEETKNYAKAKLADKKQSKQVREMQVRLQKIKEAEERKKTKIQGRKKRNVFAWKTNSEVLMGRKNGMECVEENFEIAKQGGGGGEKSKKKNRAVIDDDEYSIGIELSEEPTVQDETVV